MSHWFGELRDELHRLEAQHMLRGLVESEIHGPMILRGGRELINLAGNDYLALAQHPHLKRAAIQATENFGTGTGASRLVTGHSPLHAHVEKVFASFKHAEAALLLPTGYMANIAAVTALAGPGDLICQDKLNHASLIDAARLSGATVRTYPHLQTGKLERLLREHCEQSQQRQPHSSCATAVFDDAADSGDTLMVTAPNRRPRRFIITDSVFSMDGDCADLPALCDIAQQYEAILIVDEAHATGILGELGSGLCEAQGVSERVDVVISTASKALGGLGGMVTGRQVMIDTLINRARPMIYTTALPPAQVAAIGAAIELVQSEPWRRERVLQYAAEVHGALLRPLPAAAPPAPVTPIIPVLTGSPDAALALSSRLADAGFYAPAIRPPTVPPGTSRVRITLRADLEQKHIDRLIEVLPR